MKKIWCNVFFNVVLISYYIIIIWLKIHFDMCFDNLINFYALHHYYIAHDISWHIFLQACYKWYGYLFFKKKNKETKHLKSTFSLKKIAKWNKKKRIIEKKCDQIMVNEAYLQIILSLKYTFDNLLSHKITCQQIWIKIYECLQDIMHAKCCLIIITRLCTSHV
jgi:hypothetical protein